MLHTCARRFGLGLGLAVLGSVLLAVPNQSLAQEPTKEPIKIGFFGPITERFAGLGLDAKKGADLAVKQANAAGGIAGRKIELVVYDDRGNRTEAVAVARKLIEQDKVVAIVSGSLKSHQHRGRAHHQRSEGADGGGLFECGRCGQRQRLRLPLGQRRRRARLGDGPPCREGTRIQAFRAADAGRGIRSWDHQRRREGARKAGRGGRLQEVVSAERARVPGDDDRDQEPQRRRGHDERAWSAADRRRPAGLRARRVPESAVLRRLDLNEIDWYKGIGEHGDGTIGTLEFITPTDHPFTKAFMAAYQKEYNETIITHEAGLAYDAVRLILDAVKRGGVDREGIRKALADTKSFMNLSGVNVAYTELREPMLPIALGVWDKNLKDIKLLKFVEDPELIDPRPWYQYYK